MTNLTPTVIVDTREQAPFMFPQARVRREALKYGDYCLKGDRDGLVIERKSVRDLFGTIIKGHERFERELVRMSKCRRPVVVVEGSALDVSMANWQGGYGPSVLKHFLTLCLKHDVWPVFAESRTTAEEITWKLLKIRHEQKRRPGFSSRHSTVASLWNSSGSTQPRSYRG